MSIWISEWMKEWTYKGWQRLMGQITELWTIKETYWNRGVKGLPGKICLSKAKRVRREETQEYLLFNLQGVLLVK